MTSQSEKEVRCDEVGDTVEADDEVGHSVPIGIALDDREAIALDATQLGNRKTQ